MVISKVPEVMKGKNIKAMDLVKAGMSHNTAHRVANGSVNLTLKIMDQICTILEVESFDELFVRDNGNQNPKD